MVGLLFDSYYGVVLNCIKDVSILVDIFNLYFKVFSTSRNGLFFGILFVTIGIYFYENSIKWKNVYGIFLSIFFVLFMIEIMVLYTKTSMVYYNMYLFLLPVVSLFFIFILNLKLDTKFISNYNLLRNLSTLIYFDHILISKILKNIIMLDYHVIYVIMVSVLISYLIIIFSDKIKILKKLYL